MLVCDFPLTITLLKHTGSTPCTLPEMAFYHPLRHKLLAEKVPIHLSNKSPNIPA